jgi:hypothetical protein
MNLRRLFCSLLFGVLVVLRPSVTLAATISIAEATPTYTQDFDTLPSSGTANPWTDDSTLAGWYYNTSLVSPPHTMRASPGGVNNSGLYSYGSTGSTDRAIGALSSSARPFQVFGARFVNSGTAYIGDLTITYTGEQWRNGGNTSLASQSNTFEYRVGGTTMDDNSTGWTNVPALTFTSPTNSPATASALDGNAAANRVVGITSSIAGLNISPGTEFWIRWVNINNPGNDHGLAVDDLNVEATFVPEPNSLALVAAALMLGLVRSRRRES